jgi:hypothetical protein
VWGITLLQKGFPHKSRRHSQIYGKREAVKSKIKSAISRKSDKNKQVLKSSRHNGNKEIADFNCTKERSDFRATIARMFANRKGGENRKQAKNVKYAAFTESTVKSTFRIQTYTYI